MPTYEYACQKCGHEFEQFQSMRDEPLKKCPKCRKPSLKRLVGGGAGLIFKGSGFYITDYKNKGMAPKESSGETKPAEVKASEPKPSETKSPAPKPAEAKTSEPKPAPAGTASKSAAKSTRKK